MKRLIQALTLAILFASRADAASEWIVDTTTDWPYIAVLNESRQVFGLTCDPTALECHWALIVDIECKPGNKYPVLLNTDVSSSSHEITCMGKTEKYNKYRYQFTDYLRMGRIIRESSRIGIAFPLHGDRFNISRFNVTGTDAALSELQAAVTARNKKSPTRSTKDQQL